MKYHLFFVVGLVCLPLFSSTETESSIKTSFSGQGRLRYEHSDRTDYLSQRSAFYFRIRPEIKISKGTELSLFIQPQFAKALGKPEFISTTTTANTLQTTSGTNFDYYLYLHQAFLEYKPLENLQFTVGRILLGYGNELLLSGLEWDNIGRSFDALKTKINYGAGNVDLFYSKLFASSTAATTLGGGDGDLFGAYSTNNFGSGLDAADLYFLYRNDMTSGTSRDLIAAGARVQAKISSFDYRTEFTKEFGSQFSDASTSYQIDAEVGWTLDLMKTRIALEFFHAGATFDQLYPLGHKYLGIADVFGRKNIQGGVVHLTFTPITNLVAQFDFHYFLRTSNTVPVYKLNGATALGTGSASSSYVGTETDLILTYSLTKELSIALGGAILFPGDYLKSELGDSTPTFWYSQLVATL
jgi:hypothetical protein